MRILVSEWSPMRAVLVADAAAWERVAREMLRIERAAGRRVLAQRRTSRVADGMEYVTLDPGDAQAVLRVDRGS